MTAALVHRGPDAVNLWVDETAGIGFGHRRLSVLDLSVAGAQPMHSDCCRFTVTLNGEIYNHLELRAELEAAGAAPNWKGHSDTETLLYAVRAWGIDGALRRINGMFAFAIWDKREQTLTLCRDRFGEKPMFYGWIGSDLVFASELKAFVSHPDWHGAVDFDALTAFMRYSYVPAPATIWKGVRKLLQGHKLLFSRRAQAGDFPTPEAYWSMRSSIAAGQGRRLADPVAATDELESVLSSAIGRQLLSDVPVGAFLSGGVDSSTIVALMQRQSANAVKTFSVGFDESSFNEADHAARVARHLNTDHTELKVASSDARAVIPKLAQIYDEPFADSSQIPTHLVSMLARRSVTVALTGDAGDELFGGYNRHVWGLWLHDRFRSTPSWARRVLRTAIDAVAPEPANRLGRWVGGAISDNNQTVRLGDQLVKISRIIGARNSDEMYRILSSVDDDPSEIIVRGRETESWFSSEMAALEKPVHPLDRMTLADTLSYLTDDILQKVDRAAMSVGLETRVPFLDKDVVEFSTRVPPDMKVRDRGKWLVRQVLDRHIPRDLVKRPKSGFSIPLGEWLRGPLRSWSLDLLSPERLERQGWFNSARVSRAWTEHECGKRDNGAWLWNILVVQAWADRWSPPG